MNSISRTSFFLAASLLAGCSTFQSAEAPDQCTAVEPVACPVCPEPASQVQQCPEPQVIEKIVTVEVPAPAPAKPAKPSTAGKMGLPVVGAVEWALIEPGNIRMEARIDTGAATSSVHAEDIKLVEKDGKQWVHFSLLDPATGEKVALEQRLRRKVRIKQSDSVTQRRYVVRLWITVADTRSLVDVTLTDRDHMEYPVLVGRNLLVDTMIVDVSNHHATK